MKLYCNACGHEEDGSKVVDCVCGHMMEEVDSNLHDKLSDLLKSHNKAVCFTATEDRVSYFLAEDYDELESSLHSQFSYDDYVYNYGIVPNLEDMTTTQVGQLIETLKG